MFNYNREIVQAEHERLNAKRTAAERAVPTHLRINRSKQVRRLLSTYVREPGGSLLSRLTATMSARAGRTWRKVSGRLAGLAVNTFQDAADFVSEHFRFA